MKSKRIKETVNLGIMPEIINPCEIVDFSQLPNIDFSFDKIEIEELEFGNKLRTDIVDNFIINL